MMFLSRLNTYLSLKRSELFQEHLASYFDSPAPKPASKKDLNKLHYTIEEVNEKQVCLIHPQKGYLSCPADPSLIEHTDHPSDDTYFRIIDPKILPHFSFHKKLEPSIAKLIHQTGYPKVFPDIFIPNRDNLILSNPEYKYLYWYDESPGSCEAFIKKYYDNTILRYYKAINPLYGAAKGDFFRYLCIYMLGGVYLDMKSTVAVPLKHIIHPEDTFLLSFLPWVKHWNSDLHYIKYGSEYQQFVIMCAAGHPIMKKIIQQTLCNIKLYDPKINGTGQVGTFNTTGPIVYSRIINSYRTTKNTRLFHSYSSGVGYSVLSHDQHRNKTGSAHYAAQTSPLIEHPDLL